MKMEELMEQKRAAQTKAHELEEQMLRQQLSAEVTLFSKRLCHNFHFDIPVFLYFLIPHAAGKEKREYERKYRKSISMVKSLEAQIKDVEHKRQENFDLMVRGIGIGKRISHAILNGKPYRTILDWVAQQRKAFSSRTGKVLKSLPALSTILASAELLFEEIKTSPKRRHTQQAWSSSAPIDEKATKSSLSQKLSSALGQQEPLGISQETIVPSSMFPTKPLKESQAKKRGATRDDVNRPSIVLPDLSKDALRGFAGEKRISSEPKKQVGTTVTYNPLMSSKEVKTTSTALSFAAPLIAMPTAGAYSKSKILSNEVPPVLSTGTRLPAWRAKTTSKGGRLNTTKDNPQETRFTSNDSSTLPHM